MIRRIIVLFFVVVIIGCAGIQTVHISPKYQVDKSKKNMIFPFRNPSFGPMEFPGVGMRFTPSEFIIDCLRFLPGAKKAKVFSRIIVTPQTAIILKDAIIQNIKKYEENFGKIKIFGKTPKEIGFK